MTSSDSLTIKICGITSIPDGLAALEAGADWLGVIRWPKSRRFRTTDDAAAMLRELRAKAPRPFEAVGVYVDAEKEIIEQEFKFLGLNRIQLHGDETPEFAASFPYPTLKALRARDPLAVIDQAAAFGSLDLLIDAYEPDNPGGTGQTHDYDALLPLIRSRQVILAGGLHPGNVGDIVRRLGPWGVDVSSGVESAPGVKDHDRVRAFIEEARRAARQA